MDKLEEQITTLRALARLYRGAGLRYGIEKDLDAAAQTIHNLRTKVNELEQGMNND